MSDILFIKTSSLGDVIHHMPAVMEASRRLPAARFSWVVEEAFAPLVRLHPAVSEVIPVAARRWRGALLSPATRREITSFIAALRRRRYDEIIDSQGLLFKSATIARLARGHRHGYDGNSIREPASSWLYDRCHAVGRDQHAIMRNRILTGLSLGYRPDGEPDFGLDRSRLVERHAGPYGVLLHATARPQKQWPEASWIALGQEMRFEGSRVLPWGTEAERLQCTRIAAGIENARVLDRKPIDGMARLLAGASFVIGVDTGLLHLAAALGVPVVAIFVGSDPRRTAPMGAGPIAVVGADGAPPPVTDVLDALERLLGRSPPKPARVLMPAPER